jgi:Arc/MetJ family transcription regulator
MRISIDIDETLLAEAMKYSTLPTKKAVIEEALRFFVCLKSQKQIRALRGQLYWDGDLDAMREGRFYDYPDTDNVEPE